MIDDTQCVAAASARQGDEFRIHFGCRRLHLELHPGVSSFPNVCLVAEPFRAIATKALLGNHFRKRLLLSGFCPFVDQSASHGPWVVERAVCDGGHPKRGGYQCQAKC